MRSGLPEWMARRFSPQERYGLRVTLFALATLLVILPFSFLLVQVTSGGPLTEIDRDIADEVYEVFRPSDALITAAKVEIGATAERIWKALTDPVAIKDPTAVAFRRQSCARRRSRSAPACSRRIAKVSSSAARVWITSGLPVSRASCMWAEKARSWSARGA